MKIIYKKYLYSFFTLLFLSGSYAFGQSTTICVVPEPQQYDFSNESFSLDDADVTIKLYSKNNEPVNIAIRELEEVLSQNHKDISKKYSSSEILIGLPGEDNQFDNILENEKLFPEDKLGDEGYNLLITSDRIIIAGKASKGLFYGIQTLKQIVRSSKKGYLEGVKIIDWPDYKYRAVSDDISRGPIPTLDFMKYQIRRFAEMKINSVVPYIEHVVKTKSHPEFAPDDGSLTIEEWKEISDYARKYNITVIGGFQSFGHFTKILESPEYAHLGESGTLISPTLDESYKFLEEIYSEMIPAFDSPFFNINCDETFDLGKEQSKELVDSIGYDGVYYQHIMKLYNIVKKFNKRVIMWGDILLEYPALLKKHPKDILIGTWNYDDKDDFSDLILPIKNAGFEFWVVPGVLNSYRLFPNYQTALTNISNFSADGFKYGASGILNCVWDDGGSTLFTNSWYGVSYGADQSWNTKSSNAEKYDFRFNSGLYGSETNFLTETIHKLTELAYLEPTDGFTDKVLFARLLPDEDKEQRISLEDWDKVLMIVDEAETILNKAHLNNYPGDTEYLYYVIDLYRTLANARIDLLKVAKCYNEAENVLENNSSQARKLILNALEIINNIVKREKHLKDTFSMLWLKENHTYALDWTTDKYDQKISEFEDVQKRLMKSLKKLDSSEQMFSKEKVRLAITKLPGKYFREWMMINPVARKGKVSFTGVDYLADMGGEKNANPKVTQEFYYDGVKYRWRRIVSEYPDIVNMSEVFPDNNKNVVTYAFANISIEKDTTVKAFVGSDEGIEVFINGISVLQISGDNKLKPDAFSFSLPLKKGKNNLLLKMTQTEGDWGFTFRLPDCEVRNSKNRYRIVDDFK